MNTTNRLKGTVHFSLEGYCTKLDDLAAGRKNLRKNTSSPSPPCPQNIHHWSVSMH